MGEAWLLGALFLCAAAWLVSLGSTSILNNGVYILCAVCGTWTTLRARLVAGRFVRQVSGELAIGLLVSVVMLAGIFLPAHFLLNLDATGIESNFGNAEFSAFIMMMTGPGCVVVRLVTRAWFFWEYLRHRRILWTLIHTHLTVVFIVAILFGGTLLALVLIGDSIPIPEPGASSVIATIAQRVAHILFPTMAAGIFILVVLIAGVLPPSLLVSFFVARKTTKRLEGLAAASAKLCEDDCSARIAVDGEDEIAELQTAFNTMADVLERTLGDLRAERDRVAELLHSRRELVASVSHKLRTPVATVRGYLDSICNRAEPAIPLSVQHDLAIIEREIVHMQRLIEDLFAVSQAETRGLSLLITSVDVIGLLSQIIEDLSPLSRQREHVEIVANVPDRLPPARADAQRLNQALVNLIHNALRHTPPGGIIAVIASAAETGIRIEVCDTGTGIPPEELPHIWERFYRGEEARETNPQGTGLGLALVKSFIEAMDGTVDVRSTPGEGSCFGLILPQDTTIPEVNPI